jgi:hypothetical protein
MWVFIYSSLNKKKSLKQPIVKNDEEVEKLKEAPTAAAATVADVKRSGRSSQEINLAKILFLFFSRS